MEANTFLPDWYGDYQQYEATPLWPQGAPDFVAELGQPQPSLALFPVADGEGKGCVIVIAGGGYMSKSRHEGSQVAKRLNADGINAAVLDYRVIPYPKKAIENDVQRAVRFLRCHATSLKIDGGRIGVLGFSAGGNLAAMAAILGDDGNPNADDPVERCSSYVQAAVLCYPGVNLVEQYEEDTDPDDCYFDLQITPEVQFPPTFIWHSMEDRLIHYSAILRFAKALDEKKVPVELHFFPYGPHGQGLAPYDPQSGKEENHLTAVWSDLCVRWLKFYGFDGEAPKK